MCLEMICPECGFSVKEFVTSFRCRNKTSCQFVYKKEFPPSSVSPQSNPAEGEAASDVSGAIKIQINNTSAGMSRR